MRKLLAKLYNYMYTCTLNYILVLKKIFKVDDCVILTEDTSQFKWITYEDVKDVEKQILNLNVLIHMYNYIVLKYMHTFICLAQIKC